MAKTKSICQRQENIRRIGPNQPPAHNGVRFGIMILHEEERGLTLTARMLPII